MDFHIADTFTDSLTRLTGDEQSSAKTTAFDFQLNTANPDMQVHPHYRGSDKTFDWRRRDGHGICHE